MNLMKLLIPKCDCSLLRDTDTLRQGLEKMRFHGYTALPVLTEEGYLCGCVNEGDFLWHLLRNGGDIYAQEDYLVRDILRSELNPSVPCSVTIEDLYERLIHQNFVPVTDDRGYFIGIITRRSLLTALRQDMSIPQVRYETPDVTLDAISV